MPPKPEYWTLTDQQFKKIKSDLDKAGQMLFSVLQSLGFSRLDAPSNWLGFTIDLKEGQQLTLVSLSLIKESPITFELSAKNCHMSNPSQTCNNIYQKSFDSIEELMDKRNLELAALKEELENVL